MWNCGTFLLAFLQQMKNLQNFSKLGGSGGFAKLEFWGISIFIVSFGVFNYRPGTAYWSILMVHNLITVPERHFRVSLLAKNNSYVFQRGAGRYNEIDIQATGCKNY